MTRQASGRVIRVAGRVATVRVDGEDREARLPSPVPGGPAVAGDRVGLRLSGAEDVGVTEVLERSSVLLRGDGTARRPRPMLANIDLLLVVAAVEEPPLHPRLLDRYLVAAEVGGMGAGVVLTKADLPHDEDLVARVREIYEAIGYPVLIGCATRGDLAESVAAVIGTRIGALVGHSGVGKSTLVSRMTGEERAVGAVSRKAGTGRHTTTDPRLIDLPGGGMIADTAGVRTFTLSRLGPGDLEIGFREIAEASAECRFRDCRHVGEDGCAVPGRVSAERLDSYRRLLSEAAALTGRMRPA